MLIYNSVLISDHLLAKIGNGRPVVPLLALFKLSSNNKMQLCCMQFFYVLLDARSNIETANITGLCFTTRKSWRNVRVTAHKLENIVYVTTRIEGEMR